MIEHADYCPEKGDLRCDCDYEARIRSDEHARMATRFASNEARVMTEAQLREFADQIRADERERLVLTYGGSVAMAAVRAEEREKNARAIETAADGLEHHNLFDRIMLPSVRVALDFAAETVRGGSGD